jgi:DNA-binding transcriptional MerR regulator
VADIPVEIPNRAAFKASEVCELAQIPSYVLRSWEKEFPGLGAAARPGGPRIYRRTDIEQILTIKQLVFAEGLTLAGARRRLEGDPPPEEDAVAEVAPIPHDVRDRVVKARQELRSLLDLLSTPAGEGAPPAGAEVVEAESTPGRPLLDGGGDGVPGTPSRPPRGRRGAKQPHDRDPSKVE